MCWVRRAHLTPDPGPMHTREGSQGRLVVWELTSSVALVGEPAPRIRQRWTLSPQPSAIGPGSQQEELTEGGRMGGGRSGCEPPPPPGGGAFPASARWRRLNGPDPVVVRTWYHGPDPVTAGGLGCSFWVSDSFGCGRLWLWVLVLGAGLSLHADLGFWLAQSLWPGLAWAAHSVGRLGWVGRRFWKGTADSGGRLLRGWA